MKRKRRERDKDKLVYVERHLHTEKCDYTRAMWVAGDNVRPDDKVLRNEQNVRPYRYAKENKERPKYKPPVGPNTGAAHFRHAAALFAQVLKIGAGK